MKPEDIVRKLNEAKSRDAKTDDELGSIADQLEGAFQDLEWTATIKRESASGPQVEGRRVMLVSGSIHASSLPEFQQGVNFRLQLALEQATRNLSATVTSWNNRSVTWKSQTMPIGSEVYDLQAASEAVAAWMLKEWSELIDRIASL